VPAAGEPPQFRLELQRSAENIAVIVLEGEVDTYTAPRFRRMLLTLIEEGSLCIVVDAGKVTFMDSTALGVFLSGEKRVRPRGGCLVVISRNHTARLFEITGLDRVFTICATREEALEIAAARLEGLESASSAAL
jgi:anti-sigma B factor antagonist